ncbi:MAG TPA: TIM barrel protein [Longimicrobium sp.]|nr:TIM barrel protein [Longimicrobium sp.]HEX6036623.1 TIM barrel protein [Longimicrobium sp.]
MTMRDDAYTPRPEHRFTFGLWTVGNTGRDPFGEPVRAALSAPYIVQKLAEIGAYGVNLHDEDLVPRDASASERDRIVREFKAALDAHGVKVPMATTNLFTDPAFRDGAFTSNDPRVRRYALQKTMRSMDLGQELGASTYVFWGGREGTETNAAKDPRDAGKWFREALNFLCEYSIAQGYDYRFALEPKPNEPRGDIYLPTIGHALAFITTLDHPEMVGLNPEYAHDTMAGLDFAHGVGQAIEMGKLFHIDLNDQKPGRYDQDFRFGAVDPRERSSWSSCWRTAATRGCGTSTPRPFARRTQRACGTSRVVACARTSSSRTRRRAGTRTRRSSRLSASCARAAAGRASPCATRRTPRSRSRGRRWTWTPSARRGTATSGWTS